MPSVIPGYNYDIFISYRQNDNRSGWVTEFVKNLQEELSTTLKEAITVYFDSNSQDGLQDTHVVDDSLQDKLRCLIFIPILSQTYCDVRSFAWQHEFLVFQKFASQDRLGLKVRLLHGNVGTRILPVRIHELDLEDKQLIDQSLGMVARPVDFIFKSRGVNRPLRPNDDQLKDNESHSIYRNQINKVSNAVKEIISGLKSVEGEIHPEKTGDLVTVDAVTNQNIRKKASRKLAFLSSLILILFVCGYLIFYFFGTWAFSANSSEGRTIAVIPFVNMSEDKSQEYFSDGIAEDILNHLVKISDLKVKSRTSTLQYKGTKKPISEIGEELRVKHILEGSVRRVGDKVRIVVQLIDTDTDDHLWSETYDRELKDVLSIQSEIAIEIARALKAKLTRSEVTNIQKEASSSITAYDYFLKAREELNNPGFEKKHLENALSLVNLSTRLDPDFAQAYALKARIWGSLRQFGIDQKVWTDSSLYYASKAIETDGAIPDGYLERGYFHRYFSDHKKAKEDFEKAYEIAPGNPEAMNAYGYQLLREKNERGADLVLRSIESQFSVKDPRFYTSWDDALFYLGDIDLREELLKRGKSINPGAVLPYIYLADFYTERNQHDRAIEELKLAYNKNPDLQQTNDWLAWAYFRNGDYKNAITYWSKYPKIEASFEDSSHTVPFRHRLGMAYLKIGRKDLADPLIREQLDISLGMINGKRSIGTWSNLGASYYDAGICYAYFGEHDKAIQCLDSAVNKYGFYYISGFRQDPFLDPLRKNEDFLKIKKKIDDRFEFRKVAFGKALNRLEAGKDLKNLLR